METANVEELEDELVELLESIRGAPPYYIDNLADKSVD